MSGADDEGSETLQFESFEYQASQESSDIEIVADNGVQLVWQQPREPREIYQFESFELESQESSDFEITVTSDNGVSIWSQPMDRESDTEEPRLGSQLGPRSRSMPTSRNFSTGTLPRYPIPGGRGVGE